MEQKMLAKIAKTRKKLVKEERKILIDRLSLNKKLRNIRDEQYQLDNVLVND